MRYPVTDKYDRKELKTLKAAKWQSDLLHLNPDCCSWGNYEDYMSDGDGWDKPMECDSIEDGLFGLNDLNECVNFYFELYRKNHECPTCEASNQNPATKQLADDWYDFANTGRQWCYQLTDVEVDALVKAGRLPDLTSTFVPGEGWKKTGRTPTPEEVNKWAQQAMGHDAINRWICVEARAKHLGIYGECPECEDGFIYDEPKAHVALQLWMLHPRKGCSRGVYIKNIEQSDLPTVMAWLKTAAERNAERFAKILT